METDPEGKPLYFANGDFEKTVADIISSPRRGKAYASSSQESVFEITEKQREYYTKCFKHLLKTTQVGLIKLILVYDFIIIYNVYYRIWSLSDVNEDGWLDINEFSIAMHLIVLRVKGEVPIPCNLPPHIRPPYTPPRACSQQSQLSPIVQPLTKWRTQGVISNVILYYFFARNYFYFIENIVEPKGSWDQFDSVDGGLRGNNSETDILLTKFSDVPPLLVDSRPTAVKHSPPPQPPPRPVQRGHGRSASLDMKIVNGQIGLTMFPSTERRDSDSTAIVGTSDLQFNVQPPILTSVKQHKATGSGPIPMTPPPPFPQRISPPAPVPMRKKTTTETQTDTRWTDPADIDRFIAEFGTHIQDLLGEEVNATNGRGVERWAKRCEGILLIHILLLINALRITVHTSGLRNQNAELEAERARLAQVRIQLELRLQEIEENNSKSISTSKPTDTREASPVPEDPFQSHTFHLGFVRAAGIVDGIENHVAREIDHTSQDFVTEAEQNAQGERVARPISPSQLPGVKAIPRHLNRAFRSQLVPGEYFAKSMTRYLGPFPELPNASNLPAGDSYVILQRMGRLPESGKSIFRHVTQLDL
uniref:EF-hand domain-containing protein n=1 Tax=Heterorhabditis bacteriophora TaxID=37862 RepID=A0A1I7XIM0_HETBA